MSLLKTLSGAENVEFPPEDAKTSIGARVRWRHCSKPEHWAPNLADEVLRRHKDASTFNSVNIELAEDLQAALRGAEESGAGLPPKVSIPETTLDEYRHPSLQI